ncbi:MAG: HAD-IA family hydrolase [Akkermansiaceae bacterium]|nr:HAD-IA family hydrolase [Akkermansiaceae bacterium]
MPPSALIFDLDGTLVHSLPGIAGSLNRSLAEFGLPAHSLEAVRGFIGDGARVLAARALRVDADEDLISRLEQAFKADYSETWPAETAPYDGIIEMLEELVDRRLPLAVLSNKPHAFTTAMVEAIFPGIPFAAVLGQRAGVPHKPDPAGVLEIARRLGVEVDRCWMIGDSTMDVATARNSGARAVAVAWGYHDRLALMAAGPDVLLETPSAVLPGS